MPDTYKTLPNSRPRGIVAVEAALAGWQVHPCRHAPEQRPGGPLRKAKEPLTSWKEAATDDPAAVEAWWARWPLALVGIRTGDGVVMLDFDTDAAKGLDAATAQSELEKKVGIPLPDTFTLPTARGGYHLYFRTPLPMASTRDGSGVRGFDTRGEGGYSIIHGDVVPDLDAMATLPAAYLAPAHGLLYTPAPPPIAPPAPGDDPVITPDSETEKSIAAHLSTLLNPPEGTRHDQVRDMARLIGGYVGAHRVDYATALARLDAACANHTARGELSDSLRTLRDGLRSGMAAPLYPVATRIRPASPPLPAIPPHIDPSPDAPPFSLARTTKTSAKGVVSVTPSYPTAVVDIYANDVVFGTLRRDTFRDLVYWNDVELSDKDLRALRIDLYRTTGLDHEATDAHDAALFVADLRGYDPVRDYLNAQVWDKIPRIDNWLGQVFNINLSPIERDYCRKFLVSLAARVLNPGCQMDDCLSLIGPPGVRKSTMLRHLMPEPTLFTDTHMDLENKDTALKLQRVLLVEIGEERDFLKGGQEATKRFLSMREDFFRAPYDKLPALHPRHCCFVVTTNDRKPAIFKDFTAEARRFWPISLYDRGVVTADTQWLDDNRDQLWAEAYSAAKHQEKHYFDTPAEKAEHSAHFRTFLEENPEDALTEEALTRVTEDHFTSSELMLAMRLRPEDYGKHSRRVNRALENLGFRSEGARTTPSGNKVKVWTHPTWRSTARKPFAPTKPIPGPVPLNPIPEG